MSESLPVILHFQQSFTLQTFKITSNSLYWTETWSLCGLLDHPKVTYVPFNILRLCKSLVLALFLLEEARGEGATG